MTMTLPLERARALRWGGEFLRELRTATNLSAEQLGKVEAILRHYPSTSEIRDWVAAMQQAKTGSSPWLAVEGDCEDAHTPQSDTTQHVASAPATLKQRLQALISASEFFNQDLRTCGNLSIEQSRTLLYVRRHYPHEAEIASLSADTWNHEESNR